MRFFRCLVAIAVICGCTSLAKADPLDFHMHVLDPPTSSFPTYPILSTSFTFSFTACAAGELPDGMTADGCFAGVNRSGVAWDNLQITFADNDVLAGQPANCSPAASNNIFSDTDCTLSADQSTYTLIFTDGVINNGDIFFITEDDVEPPESFGTGSVVVLTPEPGSVLLLSTGFILFGMLVNMELRRRGGSSLLS